MAAVHGAIQGWRDHAPIQTDLSTQQRLYADRWALYSGQLFRHLDQINPYRDDPAVYNNTRLIWKHAEAVGDFYAASIYPGSLSTDGTPQPDGVKGAIPVVPQTGSTERDVLLLTAISELWSGWNWQQGKSLRPLYGAVLGDCLTELIDDSDRRFIFPQVVWPGYVTQIELDYVGNVRAYTLEYQVDEVDETGRVDSYRFRKEVDQESFRYFRDDRPWDRYGDGAEVPNPYGFVPAVWDRHRLGAPDDPRGRSALDGTWQALLELNSIFSHALDFQRKAFYAPIMIAARGGRATAPSEIGLGQVGAPPVDYAETFDIVPVPEDAQLLQAHFDIGQTALLLDKIQQGILDEAPEASFYQKIREMAQVTAPGIQRAMGDVARRVDLAGDGYDAQTVKLHQMAIAMAGFRVNRGDWNRDRDGAATRLSRRQQAFARFDLESYGRGELDFMIEKRDLIEPTEAERLEVLAMKEALQSTPALMEAWGDEDVVKTILAERESRTASMFGAGAFAEGAFGSDPRTAGGPVEDDEDEEGDDA